MRNQQNDTVWQYENACKPVCQELMMNTTGLIQNLEMSIHLFVPWTEGASKLLAKFQKNNAHWWTKGVSTTTTYMSDLYLSLLQEPTWNT